MKATPPPKKRTRGPARRWDVEKSAHLIEQRYLVAAGYSTEKPPEDLGFDAGLHVLLVDIEKRPHDAAYFLAKAIVACHDFLAEPQREKWAIDMTTLSAKLHINSRKMLSSYQQVYPYYRLWADERHAETWEKHRPYRAPHRHYLFCSLPRRVLRNLQQLTEDLDVLKDRLTVGLKSKSQKQIKISVALHLKDAGLKQPEIAGILDPDGAARNKVATTEAIRQLLKRARVPAKNSK